MLELRSLIAAVYKITIIYLYTVLQKFRQFVNRHICFRGGKLRKNFFLLSHNSPPPPFTPAFRRIGKARIQTRYGSKIYSRDLIVKKNNICFFFIVEMLLVQMYKG